MPANLPGANTRRLPITLTAQEKPYYDELWAEADSTQEGFLSRGAAMAFFRKSGLDNTAVEAVWGLADTEKHGVLGRNGFNVALRVIGHRQAASSPSSFVPATVPGPLPRFENTKATNKTIHARVSDNWSNQDLLYCQITFQNLGPTDGWVRSNIAKESFLMTGLSQATLNRIWQLADRSKIDKLNLFDFTVAHYYIKLVLYGATELPETVPQEVLEACKHAPGSSATQLPGPSSQSTALPVHNTTDYIGVYNNIYDGALAQEKQREDDLLKVFKEAEKQQAKDAEQITKMFEEAGKEQDRETERLTKIYPDANEKQGEAGLKQDQGTQQSGGELAVKIATFQESLALLQDQYKQQLSVVKGQAQATMYSNLMMSTQLSGGIGGNFAAGALVMQTNSLQQTGYQNQMAAIIQACSDHQQSDYAQLLRDIAPYPESKSDHYQKILQEIRDSMHRVIFGSDNSQTAPTAEKPEPTALKPEPAILKPEPDVVKPEPTVVKPEPDSQPLTPASTIVAPEPLSSAPVPLASDHGVHPTYPGQQPLHQQFSTNPADYVQRPVQYSVNPADYVQRPVQYSVNPADYVLPQQQQQTYSTNPADYLRPQQQQQQQQSAYMTNTAAYSRPHPRQSFSADPFDLLKKYLKPQLYTTDPNRYNTQYLTDPNQHLVRPQPHHQPPSADPNQYVVRPQPLPSHPTPQPGYHPQSPPPLSPSQPGQYQPHQNFHYPPVTYTAQTIYSPQQQQAHQPQTQTVYPPQPQSQAVYPPQNLQAPPQPQPGYPPQKQSSQPQPQQLSQPVYPPQQQQQQQQQFYPAQPSPYASPSSLTYVPPSPITSSAGLPPPPQYELIDNNKIWRPQAADPGLPLQYQAPPVSDSKAPITPTSPANGQQQQLSPRAPPSRSGNPQDRYSYTSAPSSPMASSASVTGLENSFSSLGISKDNAHHASSQASIPPPLPSRAPQYREPVPMDPQRVRAPQVYQPQYYPGP